MSSKKNKSKSKKASEGDSSFGLKEGSNDSSNLQTSGLDGGSFNFDSFIVMDFLEKAEDKTPKSCRSTLAQMGLNSMRSSGVSIGRPVLLTSAGGLQEVCLGWPVASFPGGKVGLQKCSQNNLRVKPGEAVTLQPVTGPLLKAEEVVLYNRSTDESLDTDEFRNFFLRSLDGNVVLPGSVLTLSYFGRSCSLRVEALRGEDGAVMAAAPPPPPPSDPGDSLLDSAQLSLQLSLLTVDEGVPGPPGEPGPASSTPRRPGAIGSLPPPPSAPYTPSSTPPGPHSTPSPPGPPKAGSERTVFPLEDSKRGKTAPPGGLEGSEKTAFPLEGSEREQTAPPGGLEGKGVPLEDSDGTAFSLEASEREPTAPPGGLEGSKETVFPLKGSESGPTAPPGGLEGSEGTAFPLEDSEKGPTAPPGGPQGSKGTAFSLEGSEKVPTAPPGGFTSSCTFYSLACSTRVRLRSRTGRGGPDPEAQRSKVTYSMIGGLSSQLDAIRETIELPLKHPELFSSFGIPPPRGVLLYGPPGTGKTMIGRAIANEVGAHMVVINGPEVMSKFYGETEARLRQIFSEASERRPAIIFIDELDALCPKREGAQNEVEKRVVASLLTLMDGMGSEGQLLVLGATNRPQALDPALRRPGRFDKELEVGVPGSAERADILRKQLLRVPCSARPEDLTLLADAAHGYVGADLGAVCKEAGLRALRRALAGGAVPDQQLRGTVTVGLQDLQWAMSVVKPSAMREVAIDVPKVRWSDVGGMAEVKLKLKQAVEWPLRHPEAFRRMGILPPKGVLLYGPPGCSKTMIAQALANESGLNFLAIKGPELLSKYVGESERAVREVFRKARAVAPSIVFFDEIDALAGERGSSSGSGGVGDRVLAQLLTEMDGMEQLRDVTVLAATNRPDRIDKALMRPGRLDRIVFVPLPDAATRMEIFSLQFQKMPVADDVSLEELVHRTDKYSGAEVAAVCREAALQALQEDIGSRDVRTRHFRRALDTVRPRIPDSLVQSYLRYQQQGV